jgi:hypothetical protein
MSGTGPDVEEPGPFSLLPYVKQGMVYADDFPWLISEIHTGLASIELRLRSVVMTQEGLRAALKELHMDHSQEWESIAVAEADEMTGLYLRLDRVLAIGEARADRLLRLYNL